MNAREARAQTFNGGNAQKEIQEIVLKINEAIKNESLFIRIPKISYLAREYFKDLSYSVVTDIQDDEVTIIKW